MAEAEAETDLTTGVGQDAGASDGSSVRAAAADADDAVNDGVSSLTIRDEGPYHNLPREDGDEADDSIPGIKFVDYRDESKLASVMRLVGKDLSEPYSVFTYRYFLHRFPDLCILAVPDDGESGDDPEPVGCVVCKIDEEEVDASVGPVVPACDAAVTPVDATGDALMEDAPTCANTAADAASTRRAETETSSAADSGNAVAPNGAEGGAKEQPSKAEPSPQKLTKKSGYMAMLAVDTSYRHKGIGTALVRQVVRRMRRKGCSSVTLETEVSNKAAMRLYEERLGFIREELLVRYYLNWGDAYRLRLWFD